MTPSDDGVPVALPDPNAEEPMHFTVVMAVDVPPGSRPSDVQAAIEVAGRMAALVTTNEDDVTWGREGSFKMNAGPSAGLSVRWRVVP